MPDADNNGNKIDQCPDEKEYVNGYRDFDGCDDYWEEVGSKALAGAAGVAATGGAVAAGIIAVPASLVSDDTGAWFAGIAIALGLIASAEFEYAKDPPDNINYNYTYDSQVEGKYPKAWSKLIPRQQNTFRDTFLAANSIHSLTKSKERYAGAIQVGDCAAAALQLKALQIQAEQAANYVNKSFSNSKIRFIINQQANYFRTLSEPSEIFCY